MERSLNDNEGLEHSCLAILELLSSISDADPLLQDFIQCSFQFSLTVPNPWSYVLFLFCYPYELFKAEIPSASRDETKGEMVTQRCKDK